MMNDFRTGWKLMRYTYGIKSNCIQAGVFLLMGIVFMLTEAEGYFGMMGGFFWICIAILPTQLIFTLGVADLVKVSPMRRKMQTIFPVAVNLICMTVLYLAELVIYAIRFRVRPDGADMLNRSVILLAIMMALVMVYLGVCYKHFVASTLCMVPAMVLWLEGSSKDQAFVQFLFRNWKPSFGTAAAIGFGILIAGALAEYLLTLLFYKAPLSRMAQAAPLRKAL